MRSVCCHQVLLLSSLYVPAIAEDYLSLLQTSLSLETVDITAVTTALVEEQVALVNHVDDHGTSSTTVKLSSYLPNMRQIANRFKHMELFDFIKIMCWGAAGMAVFMLGFWLRLGSGAREGDTGVKTAFTVPERGFLILQAFGGANSLLLMAQFSSAIPLSYDLMSNAGFGATASGLFIGSAFLMALPVLIASRCIKGSWPHNAQRIAIMGSCVISVVGTTLTAFAADPPAWMPVSNKLRYIGLLTGRLFIGAALLRSSLLLMMSVDVTPKQEQVWLSVVRSCCNTLGTGLGPLLCPFMTWAFHATEIRAKAAAVEYFFTAVWAFFTVFLMIGLPCNMDDLVEAREACDAGLVTAEQEEEARSIHWQQLSELSELADDLRTSSALLAEDFRTSSALLADDLRTSSAQLAVPDEDDDCAVESLDVNTRRAICHSSIAFCFERAMIVSGLESASAFVLEVEFSWSVSTVSMAVGATFFLALPLTILGNTVTSRRWLSNLQFMLISAGMSCFASVMLFPRISSRKALGSRAACVVILAADAVIFATSYLSNGILDGIALRACDDNPSSAYSRANYCLISNAAIQCGARIIGPCVARWLLELHGRSLYASLQLLVSAWGLVSCIYVSRLSKSDKQQRQEQ
mmetsp:Transcript_90000/g.178907  ORF Transcript_90000/g.178907 Transcript_90000/m.178907 type:complete len:636 (+) Transcript_90000:62-1969(+)